MPKQRQTCTRCSQRRQKCDRRSPCTRCVQNKEAHLCTTEWREGYNPSVHRRYPKKSSPSTGQHSTEPGTSSNPSPSDSSAWPAGQLPLHFRERGSGSDPPRNRSISASTDDVQDPSFSSTNVDFITYGRSEFADMSMGKLLDDKEEYSRNQARMERSLDHNRTKTAMDEAPSDGFSPMAQSAEIHHLQAQLPPKDQVLELVDYHHDCMSYWTGSIYHGPSFRKSLLAAYGDSQQIDIRQHDWKWLALLFSILSASVIGAPEAISASWGFSNAEKLKTSRQWGKCLISCLRIGEFASKYHIYTVQAIINMHVSEHLVGSTKEWAVYQAVSITIARGLGLHKLGPHPEDSLSPSHMSPEQKTALIQREIGRRVWCALVSQDWLCSTSQGTYTQQKRHYTSLLPRHYNDETWEPVDGDRTPTFTAISTYLNEVAHLLVRYLDDMVDVTDIQTKYNIVLKYDALMRGHELDRKPTWLNTTSLVDPSWPEWAHWARRSYMASSAHKIIMIHQSFLSRSFKDPRFTYTRWACTASAKTIIAAMDNRDPKEPQWWVEQAFVVTAGLCLALELFHRSPSDPESRIAATTIETGIAILKTWPTSSVAAHGIRLLTTLLAEHAKKTAAAANGANASSTSTAPPTTGASSAAAAAAKLAPTDAEGSSTSSFPPNMNPLTLVNDASEEAWRLQQSQSQAPIAATTSSSDPARVLQLPTTIPDSNTNADANTIPIPLQGSWGYPFGYDRLGMDLDIDMMDMMGFEDLLGDFSYGGQAGQGVVADGWFEGVM